MNDIDFVVLWVDDNDPEWKKERELVAQKYNDVKIDNNSGRYRDWGIFKYWFRCVEKNAPWVRKIHLVTNGQVPEWLNLKHPKLQLDVHSSFMETTSIPTFNTNAIELQLNKLPDLAEHFVYFNDDMFLVKPIGSEFFFSKGVRCDFIFENFILPNGLFSNMLMNNVQLINSFITSKREVIKNKIGLSKWFSPKLIGLGWLCNLYFYIASDKFAGFSLEHTAFPYTKSLMNEVLSTFEDISSTYPNQFRTQKDFTQYIFRYYACITGQYTIKRNTRGAYCEVVEISKYTKALRGKTKYPILCINDPEDKINSSESFNFYKEKLIEAFNINYSEKSMFEL